MLVMWLIRVILVLGSILVLEKIITTNPKVWDIIHKTIICFIAIDAFLILALLLLRE